MKSYSKSVRIESILFVRNFFGFFFTFAFPPLMLLLFGSIYGNEPSAFFGGRGAMDVTVPSYIGMVVGVNGLMSFPLSLAEYKENKIYKRFDATPAGKGIIIAAQVSVNVAMTALGILLLFVLGKLLYRIQVPGHFLPIFGAILLSMAAIFSLGFFLTAVARDAKITNLLCYLLYFVMLFISGATLPSELFPKGMQVFSKFLPLTHVVDLLKATFAGQAFRTYWVPVVALAACALVFGGAGALLYRHKRWD